MKNSFPPPRRPLELADEWRCVVPMWLHNRPTSTCSVYEPVIDEFRRFIGLGKRISQVTLQDLQDFASKLLPSQKARTVRRKLASVKSLFTFCHKTGALHFNVGAALRMPHVTNDLAEKILTPQQMMQTIQAEPNKRNRLLLRLLYTTRIRPPKPQACGGLTCGRDAIIPAK